jgi:integrase
MSDGLIESDPAMVLFTPPCKESDEKFYMSAADILLALRELDLRERLIFRLAVFGGMRPGEILAIRLGNIRTHSILIDKRVHKDDIDTPKGRKGKRRSRTVPLPAEVLAEPAEWRSLLLNQSTEAYLFPSERNTPISKDNLWRRNMLPKLQKIGIGWATFQVMRRTNASLLRKANIDDKVASRPARPRFKSELGSLFAKRSRAKNRCGESLEAEVVKA